MNGYLVIFRLFVYTVDARGVRLRFHGQFCSIFYYFYFFFGGGGVIFSISLVLSPFLLDFFFFFFFCFGFFGVQYKCFGLF